MFEYARSRVPAHCNSTLDSRIKKYPKIQKILARAMRLFGRQKLSGPQSQNELTDMIRISTNEKDCINSIKESKLYSIMADEVTASNDEINQCLFVMPTLKKIYRRYF